MPAAIERDRYDLDLFQLWMANLPWRAATAAGPRWLHWLGCISAPELSVGAACGWCAAWVGVGACAVEGGEDGFAVRHQFDGDLLLVDVVVMSGALCRVRDYAGLVGSCLVSGGGCVIFPGIVRGV